MKLVSAALSGAPNKERFIRKLNADLEGKLARKTALLEQEGFSPNHMDVVYRCPRCKDTGTLDNGASCSCYVR
jgi:DNA replication protein DnaC